MLTRPSIRQTLQNSLAFTAAFGILCWGSAAGLGTVQAQEIEFDPTQTDLTDAIECRLTAPNYNTFAFAISNEEGIAQKRHWARVKNDNPFMHEYDLPEPIVVAGHYSTRRIAFTSTGVLAVIDLADPSILGRKLGIANAMDPEAFIAAMSADNKFSRAEIEAHVAFKKFMGEKVVSDVVEPPSDGGTFSFRTVITHNVSNVTTHPGKTLYGCSYRIDMLDADGKPL